MIDLFDKRNEINTAVEGDDQQLLMRVPVLARMLHNVQQTVCTDVLGEGEAARSLCSSS